MKLDKIKFAWLIAFVTKHGATLGTYEIEDIDNLCTFNVPQADTAYPQTSDINALMALMHEGTRKIEAIKMHRNLTGCGLKESKDQVEKYWVSRGHYVPHPNSIDADGREHTLGDILATATGVRNAN